MTYLAAAIQMAAGSDKAANLERAERLIRLAAARGAYLVGLPETFNWRGKRSEEAAAAEPLEGESLAVISRLARELEFAYRRRLDNRACARPAQTLQHLRFDWSRRCAAGGLSQDSSIRHRSARPCHDQGIGRQASGWRGRLGAHACGTIGLSVCYDLRFPELYRRLTFAGAEIIPVPSCFTFPTGEAHWDALLRARAIENQAYVIAPAQFGTNVHGFSDYGNSMIVDPWGRVIGRASDQEGVVIAPIDLDYLARVRRELPALSHARLREGPLSALASCDDRGIEPRARRARWDGLRRGISIGGKRPRLTRDGLRD